MQYIKNSNKIGLKRNKLQNYFKKSSSFFKPHYKVDI